MKKTVKFQKLLKTQMKDPAFRKEYEALEEEFAIAREIISLRVHSGMTQKDLADKVRTSQPAIARLESGKYQNFSLSFLKRIGNALGAWPEIRFRKLKSA